ncbi:MAG: glycosyltransferase family 2 protein [Desulfuromonadales bacterium]|nr:glycosyltransferase family 2 protein [Desulfuromonadales bacterium]
MKVMILIPAYNESLRIGEVVRRVRELYPAYDVVVVNDGSHDRTARVAAEAGAEVVSHPFNMGYGVAIQTGYKYAVEQGYDFLVQMDGDGQHDPGYIPQLLAPVLAGDADFVLGSRFLGVESYEPSLARRLGMAFFRRLVSFLIRTPITDSTSGYQAFNRRVCRFFTTEVFPCDYPDADMLIVLHRAGFSLREVPVRMYANAEGKSMHSGLKPLYYLFKMTLSILVTLLRQRKPG